MLTEWWTGIWPLCPSSPVNKHRFMVLNFMVLPKTARNLFYSGITTIAKICAKILLQAYEFSIEKKQNYFPWFVSFVIFVNISAFIIVFPRNRMWFPLYYNFKPSFTDSMWQVAVWRFFLISYNILTPFKVICTR